jgi:hypothetical protein
MSKELLIALINKDINELKYLTRGFSEMEKIPDAIIDLSVAKAQNIVDCLHKLPLRAEKVDSLVELAVEEAPLQNIGQQTFLNKNEEKTPQIVEETPQVIDIEKKIEPITEIKAEPIIADNIQKNRISDLKKMFSIADRFRFQRELFASGEQLNTAISIFNEMNTMDEACSYIERNFKWDFQNADVKAFIAILEKKLD